MVHGCLLSFDLEATRPLGPIWECQVFQIDCGFVLRGLNCGFALRGLVPISLFLYWIEMRDSVPIALTSLEN